MVLTELVVVKTDDCFIDDFAGCVVADGVVNVVRVDMCADIWGDVCVGVFKLVVATVVLSVEVVTGEKKLFYDICRVHTPFFEIQGNRNIKLDTVDHCDNTKKKNSMALRKKMH